MIVLFVLLGESYLITVTKNIVIKVFMEAVKLVPVVSIVQSVLHPVSLFGRSIEAIFAEVIEEQRQRNKLNKDKLESRKMIVEHPFGTIKHSMKFDGFLTKRLPSVNGEFGLAALSYNFKRAFNILGFDKLIEAIQRYYYAQKSRKKAFSIFFLLFFFPLSILKAKK